MMDCSADFLMRKMKIKQGRGSSHLQNSRKFPRTNGKGEWLIYLRRNKENPLDFSCGLGFTPEGRSQIFTLRRYNGKSHHHTNRLENQIPFYDFHVHQATEKYQRSPYSDEHYAYPTDRYTDLHGAFKNFLIDCKVMGDHVDDQQKRLFE